MEPSVETEDVRREFGTPPAIAALDGVSLAVRRGEVFSLLGPSGCGKTTLLRLIAGLDSPTSGTIRIHGEDMTRVPAHRRPVNLVFQHYALFPHLTVAENVAFGLGYKGVPRSAHRERVAEALALVRLTGMETRRPHQLSGGQRQRVALARALVLKPEVLLLDEPLAALDPNLRKEVQVELKALQRTLGITFLFVTHDQDEALALSDRLAVMSQGRVEQAGTPVEVFERPQTEFVARFTGAANVFAGEVVSPGRVRLSSGAEVEVPGLGALGEAVRFVVRPEKLVLRKDGGGLPVVVEDCLYQGASTLWTVCDMSGERFTVYEQNDRNVEKPAFGPGDRAVLVWDPRRAVALTPQPSPAFGRPIAHPNPRERGRA
jgi:spermidine/putrescine transport system ATP-binding protein